MTIDGAIVQFVDSIASSPTVRLDLNAAPWRVLAAGTDISPPPLRRSVVSTLLTDGSIIPAAAFDNRTLKLHVQLDSSAITTGATQLQLLHRELNRPTNIIRWQHDPSLSPVFFKVFRAPDYDPAATDYGIDLYEFNLTIPAEAFAYGLPVSLTGVAISNDPSNAQGKFMDITSVQGDVETPLKITVAGSSVVNRQSLFAIRRGGTPSSVPFLLQAESMTQDTDTSVIATSDSTGGGASPSGSASNTSATTFATNTLTPARLSQTLFPSTAGVDVRGTYRVFARVRPGTAGAIFQIALKHGQRQVQNDTWTSAVTTTTFVMADLGLMQMPEGVDPVNDGPNGSPISVAGSQVKLVAQRISGSGSLIWDYLLFVPADDKLGIVSWGTITPTWFVVDGVNRAVYGLNSSLQIADIDSVAWTSEFPTVSPGVTNRLFYVNDVTPNPSSTDPVATTVTIQCNYWPRYLNVRPVST